MFYHLLYTLHEYFSGFNVFRYITFRSVGAILTAFLVVLFLGPLFIRMMQRFQIGQVVREDGPETHLGKSGVPTMGGMLILFAVTTATILWVDLTNQFVWLILGLMVWYGIVGAYDDIRKIRKKNSDGLSARGKLVMQIAGAILAGYFLIKNPGFDGHLSFPFFKDFRPDLGWYYSIFAVLVVVGASNAVNLTDGLDGLATGPIVVSSSVYLLFSYLAGHAVISSYLQVPFVNGAGEVAVFCGSLMGASLGFLWFVMEALSVILQVGFFKVSGGKRIFLMAPFHHHFEKKGWHETKVVVRFWIISIVLGLAALATLKLR